MHLPLEEEKLDEAGGIDEQGGENDSEDDLGEDYR